MREVSTQPYFMRAIYEWCTDQGYTPYISVQVTGAVKVPMEFVRDGKIVLNIAFSATSGLLIDNEAVKFKARFGGTSREIYVPIENVLAIFASENGQGMSFQALSMDDMGDDGIEDEDEDEDLEGDSLDDGSQHQHQHQQQGANVKAIDGDAFSNEADEKIQNNLHQNPEKKPAITPVLVGVEKTEVDDNLKKSTEAEKKHKKPSLSIVK